jgi:hypothetical protein
MDNPGSTANQKERLYEAVKTCGGWCGRADVAKLLRKVKLNHIDDKLLSELASEGRIEVQKIERPGQINFKLLFRVSQ